MMTLIGVHKPPLIGCQAYFNIFLSALPMLDCSIVKEISQRDWNKLNLLIIFENVKC